MAFILPVGAPADTMHKWCYRRLPTSKEKAECIPSWSNVSSWGHRYGQQKQNIQKPWLVKKQ